MPPFYMFFFQKQGFPGAPGPRGNIGREGEKVTDHVVLSTSEFKRYV